MRQLRNCDFCGDDAVGTFEVIPPELEPTDDEQRRVALCGNCRKQLQLLLEPLVARLRAESEDGSNRRRDDSGTSTTAERNAGRDEKRKRQTATRRHDRSQSGTATDGTGANADRTAASDDEVSVAPSATTKAASDETRAESGRKSADGCGSDTGTNGEAADSSRERASRAYVKVVQFLNSREFPMKRREAESFVAEAYGVDRDAVATIVDHAIETGEFEQKRGKLRKP
ncbi:hypothetical protein [Natronobacterium gregoryi]|uniref:Uncharacterized protein n=2 Tax=Natronobacterium gregoryi TaxID=44930 RepID=L0AHL8_NATGS|nr:hypothetical protein [Natronobacterium gregoryi]AFZ72632.1 hypothetical protein Natgr_1421 [Natronobacterium gregoryi SP2]ELY69080.1 hypothetical protein C490_08816 [Natronobacterium gregoryi SP2]PLK19106.1 hypothetical protein CYV19_16625 [Natronobacterium gregoryi SP2]SFI90263.1 hypothetical protein SAMN05443661_10913 [Natronobacterium gregoryi]